MFSKLAKKVMKKNFTNFKVLYNQSRNLTKGTKNPYKKRS